jgi:DNA-binding response OmpR family regulator
MNTKLTRILLIEDNPADAALVREMLKRGGGEEFELEWVDRLSTGLECLKNRVHDVILLDLGLPDSLGLESLIRVRNLAASVPLIVLTGLNDDSAAVSAVRQGAQDFLVKGQGFPLKT